MVAIFVVATIIVFLVIDYFVQRAEKRKASLAPAAVPSKARFVIPKGYFFGKGHTWVELLSNGMARVGVDDFVQRIVGRIEKVTAVPVGTDVKAGEKLFSIGQGDKVVSLRAPISGKVSAFNDDLSGLPHLVNKDTYNGGWVAVIQPSDLSAEIKRLPIGSDAAMWLKEEIKRFRNFITSQAHPQETGAAVAGATLMDGGVPVNGVMERVAQDVWKKFEADFLA